MRTILAACLTLFVVASPSSAETAGETSMTPVMELFSSQGCGNCPKALNTFQGFADRDDVIPLTYAVGYWDYLGWADTFAKPDFTERQVAYNDALGRRGPYTPQMVFNGNDHCSGAKARTVEKKLQRIKPPTQDVSLVYDGRAAKLTGAPSAPLDVWLIDYTPGVTTAIPMGGGNSGVEMGHLNLVTELTLIGEWSGGETLIDAACEGACVVLVQEADAGPIQAAAQYEPIGLTASN